MFAKQIAFEMRPILGTPGETYPRDIRKIDTEAVADVLERTDGVGCRLQGFAADGVLQRA
jgi:hypothetical protein